MKIIRRKQKDMIWTVILFILITLSFSQDSTDKQDSKREKCNNLKTESICSKKSDEKYGIALIGNPGTGKSTLLNGLIGKPVFKSGISFGTGLTTTLNEYKYGKLSFFDTPGLNDISTRKQAGREIDQLLKRRMNLKLGFVITLQSGRVNPEDVRTLHLVLDAISINTTNRFGIIVNKLSSRVYHSLATTAESRFEIKVLMEHNNRSTTHWRYIKDYAELRNADNKMLKLSDVQNLFDNLPITKYPKSKIEDIDTDTMDEKLIELEEEHELKLKRLELLSKAVGLLAAGTVTLNIIFGHGWLLKYCKDATSAAWVGQQLPTLVNLMIDSGEWEAISLFSRDRSNKIKSFLQKSYSQVSSFSSKVWNEYGKSFLSNQQSSESKLKKKLESYAQKSLAKIMGSMKFNLNAVSVLIKTFRRSSWISNQVNKVFLGALSRINQFF